MHRTVQFKSTWVNEPVFDENDNQEAPGARDLAEAIAAVVADHVSAVTRVENHSYYGWSFDSSYDGATFEHVLNPVDDEGYLTVRYVGFLVDRIRFRKPGKRFDKYCELLRTVLPLVEKTSDFEWTD
ncbi:MAG: hypothetical protein QGG36_04400 [Pirellulaceae bacterium]|jgi:hypothetical protein|nr:hypothetical protein [Pirellulaceae bacterium]MDP7015011.1 hypothetical protein [Pirellulaceae bacterium]